jgi:hypothetical protein
MTAASGASAPPLNDLHTLVRQAQTGDRSVLPALKAHLDAHPELWQTRGNLAQQLKTTLIAKVAGAAQLATQEAILCWWDHQVTALAGPQGAPLEQLLAEDILTCWFDWYLLRLMQGKVLESGALGAMTIHTVEHMLDAAQGRYLKAVKTLAQIRKLGVPVVQVNIGTHQVNTAG